MPTVKKPASKGKKGLTKKVGPLPLYAYLIGVGIVVLYFYYRHRNSGSTSVANTVTSSLPVSPTGIDVVPSGNANNGSGGGSVGNDSFSDPNTFPVDYATQTDLASAIESINNNTAQTVAGITFPQPTVNITVPPNNVNSTTTKSKTAAKKAAIKTSAIKYYTYKTKVPLKAGQTLHFSKGKGYYAA